MTVNYLALVDKLPKMSPLTMQMLRVLTNPDCSVGELAEIAGKDAAPFAAADTMRSTR